MKSTFTYSELKEAHEKAVREKRSQFYCGIHRFDTNYTKYFLEYVKSCQNGVIFTNKHGSNEDGEDNQTTT